MFVKGAPDISLLSLCCFPGGLCVTRTTTQVSPSVAAPRHVPILPASVCQRSRQWCVWSVPTTAHWDGTAATIPGKDACGQGKNGIMNGCLIWWDIDEGKLSFRDVDILNIIVKTLLNMVFLYCRWRKLLRTARAWAAPTLTPPGSKSFVRYWAILIVIHVVVWMNCF